MYFFNRFFLVSQHTHGYGLAAVKHEIIEVDDGEAQPVKQAKFVPKVQSRPARARAELAKAKAMQLESAASSQSETTLSGCVSPGPEPLANSPVLTQALLLPQALDMADVSSSLSPTFNAAPATAPSGSPLVLILSGDTLAGPPAPTPVLENTNLVLSSVLDSTMLDSGTATLNLTTEGEFVVLRHALGSQLLRCGSSTTISPKYF